MKVRCLAALVVLLVFAGCGKTGTQTVTQTIKAPAFVCHHRVPAAAGECIAQELKAKAPGVGLTLTAPRVSQCVDVSVWQGVPNFRAAGVRCVIIQTNDGAIRNRLFYEQVAAAKQAHIPWGVYAFIEPQAGTGQADIALSMSNGRGRSLGVWADTEVPGAYQQACSFDAQAHRGAFIVGVYASPGNWPGYRCAGYIYPAEWGSGRAYPLAGYPVSALKLRQWCGTCRLSGFSGEVDRDEDLGLLALGRSPVRPKPAPTRQELDALLGAYSKRNPHGHNCAKPPFRHAYPSARYDHACAVWAHEMNQLKGNK